MSPTQALRVAGVSVAASILLAGCASQPADEPTGAASSSPPVPSEPTTAPASPAPSGVPASFTIPACEQQVDAATVQAAFGADVAFIADTTDTWQPVGPAAQDALAGAEESVACLWGVPNSGRAVTIAVAKDPNEAPDLIAALREAVTTFSEEQVGSALVFTGDDLEAGDLTTAVTYVFDGAAWISVGGGELATPEATREVALAVHGGLTS